MKKRGLKKTQAKKDHSARAVYIIIGCILLIIALIFIITRTNNDNQSAHAATRLVWAQFEYDAEKSGINPDETLITSSTVSQLKKIWQVPAGGDGAPVFLSGVTTPQGVLNLVFVTTTQGKLIAFNEANGTQVWSVQAGNGRDTTSSPAIDPSLQYIYSYGTDGKVHKYDVGTGTEETAGGWPLTATTIPNVEHGSAALSIEDGYLYVTTSGYPGDQGPYVGHIVGKNLTTGVVSVFNTLCDTQHTLIAGNCSQQQSGVWARPGAVFDPKSGDVFIASGNGPYQPPDFLADSVIKLTPNLQTIIDTYTPSSYQDLDDDDADLGSSLIGIVQNYDIGIQGGKDDKIRVLNLANLSGQGAPYHTEGELQTIPVPCNILSNPISWVNGGTTWVFVTDMCHDLFAYKVTANRTLQQVYQNGNDGGSSPVMVNGVLFIQTSGSIHAIDPTTGNILWTGQLGSLHWQSPIVVDGHVFAEDNGNLTAFGLPDGIPTIEISPTVTIPIYTAPPPSPTPTPIIPTYYILQLGGQGNK